MLEETDSLIDQVENVMDSVQHMPEKAIKSFNIILTHLDEIMSIYESMPRNFPKVGSLPQYMGIYDYSSLSGGSQAEKDISALRLAMKRTYGPTWKSNEDLVDMFEKEVYRIRKQYLHGRY